MGEAREGFSEIALVNPGWGPVSVSMGATGTGRVDSVVGFEMCQEVILDPNLPVSSNCDTDYRKIDANVNATNF